MSADWRWRYNVLNAQFVDMHSKDKMTSRLLKNLKVSKLQITNIACMKTEQFK